MEHAAANTPFTWYAVLTVLISAVVSLVVHWILVRHVYKALKDLDKSRAEHEKRPPSTSPSYGR